MKMEREEREHGGLEEDSVSVHVFRVALFHIEHIEPGVVLFFLFTSCFSTLTEQLRRGV